jgi:hypothetical protein
MNRFSKDMDTIDNMLAGVCSLAIAVPTDPICLQTLPA